MAIPNLLTEEMMSALNTIAAKTESVITIRSLVDPKHPESGEQVLEFTKGFSIWNRTESSTPAPEKDPRDWMTPENRHEPWPTPPSQLLSTDEAREGHRVLLNSPLRPEFVPVWCYARERVVVLDRELVIEVAQLRPTDPFYSPTRVLFDVVYDGGNCADFVVVASNECLALIGEESAHSAANRHYRDMQNRPPFEGDE